MGKSRNRELVKEHYTIGQKCYQQQKYEDAWKNFDKAISFGGKTLLLLDSKAASMCKLPEWRRHAFEVTKDMIQKYPNDWQGYYRQAKVLQALGALDKALISANAAVKHSPKQTDNDKAFRAIQSLRADIVIEKDTLDRQRAKNDAAEHARQVAARRAAVKAKTNYTHLLSQDILVTICEAGMKDQPSFPLRMAGVCRYWRHVLLSQGSVWNKVVLGKKRVMEKSKLYMERTNGRIKEITFATNFDTSKATEVAEILLPCLKSLRNLHFQIPPDSISKHWKEALDNLVSLRVSGPRPTMPALNAEYDLVYGLLSERCTSLRELDTGNGTHHHLLQHLDGPHDERPYTPETHPDHSFWTKYTKASLSNMRVLRLSNKIIFCSWDLSELLCHFPLAETILLDELSIIDAEINNNPSSWYQWRQQQEDTDIVLPNLRSFAHTNSLEQLRFDSIHAPKLLHLDLWGNSYPSTVSVIRLIKAPGLRLARQNLLSLDIGKSPVDQNALLEVLHILPSLKFLNVSYCAVNNTFVEALERKSDNGENELLPNLTALSMAGCDEITGGPLRRLVHSRLPSRPASQTLSRASSQTSSQMKRGSAFRPSTPRSPFGPKQSSKPKSSLETSISSSSSPFIPTIEPSSSQTAPTLPSLNWLCIDNCTGIEVELSDQLRSKVRFLSHTFSAVPTEVRVRGRGKWSWEAEYTSECGSGVGGCGLRKLPGTKDGWYVHHICPPKEKDAVVARSWTQLGNQPVALNERM